jgi:hypothetical protein
MCLSCLDTPFATLFDLCVSCFHPVTATATTVAAVTSVLAIPATQTTSAARVDADLAPETAAQHQQQQHC